MANSMENKLKQLGVGLNLIRNVPGNPNEFITKRSFDVTQIEHQNEVK